MAKELTTALILRRRIVEWTTMQRDRGTGRVVDFQRRAEGGSSRDAPAETGLNPKAPGDFFVSREEIGTLCHGVSGQLHVGLPAECLLLRVFALPAVPAEELRGMVELQLDKISPFPVEDMVFSHEPLAQDEEFSHVLVVAARLDILDGLGSLLSSAGLRPERLDAAIMGWWPLLRDAKAVPDAGRHLHLLVHDDGADMLITMNGRLAALRRLPEAGSEAESQSWARDTLWEIRQGLAGMDLEHGSAGQDSMTVWHAEGSARSGAAALHDLCETKPEMRGIEELPPLSEGLARRGLRADHADLLDLTPQQWRHAERSRNFKKRMKQAVLGLTALWIAFMGLAVGGRMVQEHELDVLRRRQAEWAEPAGQVREMRDRVRMIRRFSVADHSAIECLREAVRLLPNGIELTSFTYRKGEGVQISGQARTIDQVYEYQTRMDGSGLFERVSLSGPRHDSRRGLQLFDMDIVLPEEA